MPSALYNTYKKEYYNSKDEMMEERRKKLINMRNLNIIKINLKLILEMMNMIYLQIIFIELKRYYI